MLSIAYNTLAQIVRRATMGDNKSVEVSLADFLYNKYAIQEYTICNQDPEKNYREIIRVTNRGFEAVIDDSTTHGLERLVGKLEETPAWSTLVKHQTIGTYEHPNDTDDRKLIVNKLDDGIEALITHGGLNTLTASLKFTKVFKRNVEMIRVELVTPDGLGGTQYEEGFIARHNLHITREYMRTAILKEFGCKDSYTLLPSLLENLLLDIFGDNEKYSRYELKPIKDVKFGTDYHFKDYIVNFFGSDKDKFVTTVKTKGNEHTILKIECHSSYYGSNLACDLAELLDCDNAIEFQEPIEEKINSYLDKHDIIEGINYKLTYSSYTDGELCSDINYYIRYEDDEIKIESDFVVYK